jgi:hypothetical protein
VWFDVAGPHAMQAEPLDVLDALQLETPAADAADSAEPTE